MKKGLRQIAKGDDTRALQFEHFPDEEGIKTSCLPVVTDLQWRSNTSLMKKGLRLSSFPSFRNSFCSNTSLMKKGLRPRWPRCCEARAWFEHFPDEEGIKTLQSLPSCNAITFEHFPDEEGIKTNRLRGIRCPDVRTLP